MKRMSVMSLGLVGLLVAGNASANWSTNSVTLTGIEIDSSTLTYLSFSATPTNKPSCTASGQGLINLSASLDSQKALTSLATAAFLAGKTVTVHWTGSCSASIGGFTYPLIDSLSVT
jgi:hypothetical protein